MRTKILLSLLLISVIIIGSNFDTFTNFINSNNMIFFKQKGDYNNLWIKVDSLIGKNLPESALKQVDLIYNKAKTENNLPHVLKSLIYKSMLTDIKEEKSYIKIFSFFDEELKTAQAPLKNMLHSMKAELLWRYYSSNKYILLDRTQTIDFDNNDIETWDMKKLIDAIIKEHLLALKDEKVTKQTSIKELEPIIIYGTYNNYSIKGDYRPTLYDFIAHRAIDVFSAEEPSLTRPLDYFKFDSPHYFNILDDFSSLKIHNTDTFSLKYYALKIYQDLVAFHLKDASPTALVDVEIARLKFVHSQAELENKDELLYNAFIALEKKYITQEASADISYEIALLDYARGLKYNPSTSEDYKWDIKKAYDRCKLTAKQFSDTYGGTNCMHLIDKIQENDISITAENYVPAEKPFLALANYKNIDKAYIRLVKVDYNENKKLIQTSRSREDLMKSFIKMSPTESFNMQLPDDKDFQYSSVEIPMPTLSMGYYLILISDNSSFDYKGGNNIAYSFVQVTNLSFLNRRLFDGTHQIFVLDRNNGAPIPQAKVQTYIEEYDFRARKYEIKKWKSFTTDEKGLVEIAADNNNSRSFFVEISQKNDILYIDRGIYQYGYREEKIQKITNTHFFTDRAIYRPGQTVYFKGIVIQSVGDEKSIVAGHSTNLIFYDANRQKQSELTLKTNDFGTFSGSFTIPTGLMTGQMSIANETGSAYFNVEEYKRPKFEAKFEPVKGVYRLNENIKVIGTAQAYAGNNIDGAEVKYRIVRNTYYPYFFYRRGWSGFPSSSEIVMKTGQTVTDINGKFEVNFDAIPDNKTNKSFKPVFNYTIYADITDISGETRSAQTTVIVGYTALMLNAEIPNKIEKSHKGIFEISTTNLNGEKEDALCHITVFQLKQPESVLRDRLWQKPTKKLMSFDDFRTKFPKDIYEDENNIEEWNKEASVFSTTANTKNDNTFQLKGFNKWTSGVYRIEITTKDAFGEDINQSYNFILFDNSDKKIPTKDINWVHFDKFTAEPGENVSLFIGTADTDINVLYEIEYNNNKIESKWIKLNKEQRKFNIPIKEEHRGNISVHISFVKDNRTYRNTYTISVPYTNKELEIEFATFRNKLLPGQKEEWQIIIKDKFGDKALAELLSCMYDASLDAFAKNHWFFNILRYNYSRLYWDANLSFGTSASTKYNIGKKHSRMAYMSYDKLNWFGFNYYNYGYTGNDRVLYDADEIGLQSRSAGRATRAQESAPMTARKMEEADQVYLEEPLAGGEKSDKNIIDSRQKSGGMNDVPVPIRTNFNETAFFYPHLATNSKGEVVVSFTVPESLTRWRILNFAHTKDLKYGLSEKELVTQKELMITANAPRFFRENDKIVFSAKISNMSDKDLSGIGKLELFDALNMQPIDNILQNFKPEKSFTVLKGQSTLLTWELDIKQGVQAITYRVTARSGSFSDGEEMLIPVLSNRMLVTESLTLPIRGKTQKTYNFDKLLHASKSKTLSHHKLTLEFTSNPAWYAIQALPYLMEFPYECSEQIFSRYYANAIASFIANSSPKIKRVFDTWRQLSPDALLSNLEKNQELKMLILEETPWVMNGQNESERKKRVAQLFELNKMGHEKEKAVNQLLNNQSSNGGWPWFKGMPDDRYITQHIVSGFGKLNHIGIESYKENHKLNRALNNAVKYLDARIKEDYDHIKRHYASTMHKEDYTHHFQVHYLYTRSFFKDIDIARQNREAYDYFFEQALKYWPKKTKYVQGMIALVAQRYNKTQTATDIIKALKENALYSEEMGMYWKDNTLGYYWYQAPIETHALLIEVFEEVAKDKAAVEELKIWLIKQKQTQDWKTTKATAEAIYALILRGTDALASDKLVNIKLGDMLINPKTMEDVKVEAGTGYFKTSWNGSDIKPEYGKVHVHKEDDGVAWGALYWQYFEDLDKITSHETPLSLKKQLFIEKQTAAGKVLMPIKNNSKIKIGDKIITRIELRVDRDMEYVHMKDMRASAFEPTNVLTQYKYQGGLGYIESTRDAATHFFFSYMQKGTYVFEYPMFATHKGNFANGVTSIQCMYAPEFTSHSEGIRVTID